jgi:hypothetical protein
MAVVRIDGVGGTLPPGSALSLNFEWGTRKIYHCVENNITQFKIQYGDRAKLLSYFSDLLMNYRS